MTRQADRNDLRTMEAVEKKVAVIRNALNVGGGVEARIFGGDTRFSWAAA